MGEYLHFVCSSVVIFAGGPFEMARETFIVLVRGEAVLGRQVVQRGHGAKIPSLG